MARTRCCYCRIETVMMFSGVPCCEGCMARCICASCEELHHRYQLHFFGEDGICDECLADIVDELVDDDDPNWTPPAWGQQN